MRPTPLLLTLALTSLGAATLSAQAPAASALRPAPSTRATSEVSLSIPRKEGDETPAPPPVTIRLDYGQPHLRGRSLHTDSLVPYDTPWRTGANNPTTLTTGVDLTLGGAALPAGTYVLYTLPSRAGWKLIVQKSAGQSGDYDPAHDVARIDLRRQALAAPVESLTMWLIPSTAPGQARGELRLAWGASSLSTDWVVK